MTRFPACPGRVPAAALLLLLCAFVALGCGEDEPAGAPPAEEAPGASEPWSDPAVADPVPAGPADGSAAGVLARLRARVAEGRGSADPAFGTELRDVAEVLWPVDGTPEQRAGAQVHVQLAPVAVDVGAWLKAGADARAERTKSDPVDVEIHDAFLAAAASPEAYKRWCESAGRTLLEKMAAERRRKLFPPK